MTHTRCNRTILARTMAALLTAALTATPLAAAARQANVGEIPTRLVLPTDPERYPDPICLGCKLVTTRAPATNGADADGAVLQLSYVELAAPTFEGSLVLTVFLAEGNECRTIELDVVLVTGHNTEIWVSEGEDWSWEEVETVWIELVRD